MTRRERIRLQHAVIAFEPIGVLHLVCYVWRPGTFLAKLVLCVLCVLRGKLLA